MPPGVCWSIEPAPTDFVTIRNQLPTTIQLRMYVSSVDGLGVERSDALTGHETSTTNGDRYPDVIMPNGSVAIPRPTKNRRRHEQVHLLISLKRMSILPLTGIRFRERYGWSPLMASNRTGAVAYKWKNRLRNQRGSYAAFANDDDESASDAATRAANVRSSGLIWLPMPTGRMLTLTTDLLPTDWNDLSTPRLRL